MHRIPRLALIALLALALPAAASDKAKEQRWAEQIVDQLIEGEAVWLEAGTDRFLGILTEAEGTPRGAVILLHGIGVHPNWPQVIYPLRVELTRLGWTTLSLQMPVLPNEAQADEYTALFPEVPPRIDAALGFLAGRDLLPAALVAHSMGATMGGFYLRDAQPGGSISAFVAIGVSGRNDGGSADAATSLARIGIPVLDLYGERDLESVLNGAERRYAAGSKNPGYTQRVLSGANHFFDNDEAALVAAVGEWLETQAGR